MKVVWSLQGASGRFFLVHLMEINPIHMKKIANHKSLLLIALVMLLASCAPGNEHFDAVPAGFWAGLWHGFISFFTFIISLFNDTVKVYEIANKGHLYDLGFILGIMFFYGGGSKGTCRRRR